MRGRDRAARGVSGKIPVGVSVAGRAEAPGARLPETLREALAEVLVLLFEYLVLRFQNLYLRLQLRALGFKLAVIGLKNRHLRLKLRALCDERRSLLLERRDLLPEDGREGDLPDDVHEPAHGSDATPPDAGSATPEGSR